MKRLSRVLCGVIAVNTLVMGKLTSILTGGRLGRLEKRQIAIETRLRALYSLIQKEQYGRFDVQQERILQDFLDGLGRRQG